MKTLLRRPVFWALGAGTLGFILHLWAYRSCLDRNGLWVQSHPVALCLLGLTAAFFLAALFFTLKEKNQICLTGLS